MMPNTEAETMNQPKLDTCNAKAASKTETAADIDASVNPARRPIRLISMLAGLGVTATLTTIMDTGNVASAGLLPSVEPMMPPSVTSTIEPVAEINWQVNRIVRFRTDIDGFYCSSESI